MKNRCLVIVMVVLIASMFLVGTASAACSGYSGRDYFGYYCSQFDSSPPGARGAIPESYEWEDINYANEILPNSDDNYVTINFSDVDPTNPFRFNFYGNEYTEMNISNNGIVFGGPGTTQFINQRIGMSNPHNFIAPYWDDITTWDLGTGPAGRIYYDQKTSGGKTKFIIEWNKTQHFLNSTQGITFRVILYKNIAGNGAHRNAIKFEYKYGDCCSFGVVTGNTTSDFGPFDNGGSATIGIEGPGPERFNQGVDYSFNQQDIGLPGRAILFYYPINIYARLSVTKEAPKYVAPGSTINYILRYYNYGTNEDASDIVLNDTLPSGINCISPNANCGGTAPISSGVAIWDMGPSYILAHETGDSRMFMVQIPSNLPNGSMITNKAAISYFGPSSTDEQYAFVDANTTISPYDIPTGVSVSSNNTQHPMKSDAFGTPTTWYDSFVTYNYTESCSGPTPPNKVRINITLYGSTIDATGRHIPTSVIYGSQEFDMNRIVSGDNKNWTFTMSFLKVFGHWGIADVVFRTYCDGDVSFKIYVDPSGVIRDLSSNQRIWNATVWLMHRNETGEFEKVSEGSGIMDPDRNPQITGDYGQFQWNVTPGYFYVHVEAPGYYPKDYEPPIQIPPPFTEMDVYLEPMQRSGSLGVGITPKITTKSRGTTIDYTIMIKSIQNFDDRLRVNITADVPAGYQIPLDWFNWTYKEVDIGVNSTVSLPLRMTIPGDTPLKGTKSFKINANSTFWITKAYGSGVVTIS